MLKGIIEQIDSSRYIWGSNSNTTIRDGYLGHLHSFVEGDYNFDDLTEQNIVNKINEQNAIIAKFLNYIATILKPEAMRLYEIWLSSPEYKQITSNIIDKNLLQLGYTPEELNELNGLWDADDSQDIPVEYNGEDPSSTDKPVEEYKKAMEEYIRLNSLFKPKITQLGAGGFFSRFKGKTNKILSRETPVSSNRSSNSRSNSNRSSNSSLGFNKEDIALLNFVEREVEGIPYIYSYIQGDIIELLIVLNKVLAYIDIMAIFFLNKKPEKVLEVFRKKKETDKKTQDSNVAVSIKKIINDSIEYKAKLRRLCDTNTMFSMIDNIQIYSSLYISIYGDDEMLVYNRSGSTGGRKRAIGRPRKTPAKPAKKPATKPTKKPTKPTTKKPTKPTTKPTTKPAKPVSKKPTKPTAKPKPTVKKPTKK
jgi:hypothetical protein